jgi:stearoyl-CoA desaturase (delta-9 desaturase)
MPDKPDERPSHTGTQSPSGRSVRVRDALPILAIHAACLAVPLVGWSAAAVLTALALLVARMFFITAFYHRYFSHRTFRTHRATQFVFALLGVTAAQRGPIWWAAHHRDHHRHSDHDPDIHSPSIRGLIWSHTGWFLTEEGKRIKWHAAPDWARYPELRWLERNHLVGPIGLIAALALAGWALLGLAPGLGTGPAQMVVWGFGVSTTLLYHTTFTINSLAHTVGSRRFRTADQSRNNWLLAVLTLGEGWHNNHHYFPGSARQGFYWWEVDVTYYILVAMERLGLIWDLRPVPERVYEAARRHASLTEGPGPRG